MSGSPALPVFVAALRRHAAERGVDPAIQSEAGPVSWGQVLDRVARWLTTLERLGAQRGSLVAIVLPRGVDWVAVAVASHWLGAAFLPIDPAVPLPRRAQLLEIARPGAVIDEGVRLADSPSTARPVPVGPTALAYVIFTSGSTGHPKGVAIAHAGLEPMLKGQVAAFRVTSRSRTLWMLSPGFDASISDVGVPLLAGATLVVAPSAIQGPDECLAFLAAERVTHADIPPSLLQRLDPARRSAFLETLIVGGEAAPLGAVRAWADRVRVLSVYGPTEATVCASIAVCDPAWDRPWLGAPIAGLHLEVCDEQGEAISHGADGELWIGGPGVALGYLGPASERSPFSERDGVRWYRTGDRVRQEPGGLVFVGRVDREVKVRGHRVAPEEIEAQLMWLPGVQAAVVLPHAGRLVAWVEGQVLDGRAIRRRLTEHLPAALVPARIVGTETLPRHPSGKVDAVRLFAELDQHRATRADPDPLVATLQAAFLVALGVDVEPDEAFGDAGGDSLRAVEVVAALRAADHRLPLAAVHPSATPRELADWLRQSSLTTPRAFSTAELTLRVGAISTGAHGATPRYRAESRGGAILVTGATGFLGGQIVRCLLRQGRRVVAIVRARDTAHATMRLRRCLGPSAEDLEVATGDIAEAGWGLTHPLPELAAIVVAAGGTSSALTLDDLWAPNVLCAATALAFASSGAALHWVSSLAVFASRAAIGPVAREDDPLEGHPLHGDYAASKWAAEALLQSRAGRSRVAIHRPGLLVPDNQDMPVPASDWLTLTIRGIAELGAVSDTALSLRFDATPVSWCAAAIAELARVELAPGVTAFHQAGPHSISLAEVALAFEQLERPVEILPLPAFRARLAQRARNGSSPATATAALSLLGGVSGPGGVIDRGAENLFLGTGVRFDTTRTIEAVGATIGPCPEVDLRSLVARVLCSDDRA